MDSQLKQDIDKKWNAKIASEFIAILNTDSEL